VNGITVKTSTELTREVAKAKPGDTLRLDVLREGKHHTIEIRSGIRPSEQELAANDNTPGSGDHATPAVPSAPHPMVLGMALGVLDEATRRHINAPPEIKGVVVESVDSTSDAGQKGLHRGDVIVQAGGHPVTTAAEVASVVDTAKKAGRTGVLLGVFRQGRTTFLPIKIGG